MSALADHAIETSRLRLRSWLESDRAAFAKMNADPEVMYDLGGPIGIEDSNAKFDRFASAWKQSGLSRWLIETNDGNFVGYTGVLRSDPDHPLGGHFDIGWRLVRRAWGKGYATEAAKVALADAFSRVGMPEILACTAPDNLRSQAVMERLALERDPLRDFNLPHSRGVGTWRGLVWSAKSSSRWVCQR